MDISDLETGQKLYISAKPQRWKTIEVYGHPARVEGMPEFGDGFCLVFINEKDAKKQCGEYGYLTMTVEKKEETHKK